jgi:hypothetical protein
MHDNQQSNNERSPIALECCHFGTRIFPKVRRIQLQVGINATPETPVGGDKLKPTEMERKK